MRISTSISASLIWFFCLTGLSALSQDQEDDSSSIEITTEANGAASSRLTQLESFSKESRVLHVSSMTDDDSTQLRLGDYIRVRVSHLAEVIREYKRQPNDLRLFINDIEFKSSEPVSVDTANGTVVFKLKRHTDTEGFWQMFYRLPYVYEHPSRIGLGFADTQIANPYPATGKLSLVLIREQLLLLGIGLVILFGGIIFLMSRKGKLIREDWSSQQIVSKENYLTIPFSMAKTQLAFWTFLIISGYFLIWLVTGELADIPSSILALLGISLTSHVVSKGINQTQDTVNNARHQDKPSKGFFTDILNDENGLSIPRLQFLLFNIVIGGSFIRDVVKNWSLPDLGTTTLAMLSISGAGYLIVKTSENNQLDVNKNTTGDRAEAASSNTSEVAIQSPPVVVKVASDVITSPVTNTMPNQTPEGLASFGTTSGANIAATVIDGEPQFRDEDDHSPDSETDLNSPADPNQALG